MFYETEAKPNGNGLPNGVGVQIFLLSTSFLTFVECINHVSVMYIIIVFQNGKQIVIRLHTNMLSQIITFYLRPSGTADTPKSSS